MKKDKKPLRETLLEGILEIVLTLLCFGMGALIIRLFGVNLDSPNIDGDLIILLGVVVFLIVLGAMSALMQWFKKILSGKPKA